LRIPSDKHRVFQRRDSHTAMLNDEIAIKLAAIQQFLAFDQLFGSKKKKK
jgi:hypothetical protein